MPLPTMGPIAPLVSVVVATYNRLDSLLWLLNDLRMQKPLDGDIEVVVVDDGSARSVDPELAAREYPFALRVLTQANAGPAAARHAGIEASTGALIVVVDDDMVLPETFLAAHMEAHRGGADVVLGHIRGPRDCSALSLFEQFHQNSLDRFVTAYRAGTLRLDGGRLCTGNVSFPRSKYFEVGGFDQTLGRLEDRELGIRFESAGMKLAFSEDAWNEHRSDHEDVATWRRRSRQYGELDVVISARYRLLPDVSPWAFLPQLPRIAWPFAFLAACLPEVGRAAAAVSYAAGEQLENRGRTAAGLHGAAVCYAMDYFSGVGTRLGSPRAVVSSLRSWRGLRSSGNQ